MSTSDKNIDLEQDLKWISKYQKTKDQADLAPFFRKYMGMIYGVCLKYLKEEEESKDSVMDIYEKLVSKLLTHDVTNPKSWLYIVVKNHCFEILRKNTRVLAKENDAALMYYEEVFHPNTKKDEEEEYEMLHECVQKLESQQQRAIRLFYLEKKSYKEVTEIMNISWSNARSFIQNGRRNLKNCMESKYESVGKK